MAKLSETQVRVDFVLDDKSQRPRIRIEIGTWYECEIMPPEIFFQLCAEYWENRESVG